VGFKIEGKREAYSEEESESVVQPHYNSIQQFLQGSQVATHELAYRQLVSRSSQCRSGSTVIGLKIPIGRIIRQELDQKVNQDLPEQNKMAENMIRKRVVASKRSRYKTPYPA